MPRIASQRSDAIEAGIKRDLADASDNFVFDERAYYLLSNGVLIVREYTNDGSIISQNKVRIIVDGAPTAKEFQEIEKQEGKGSDI